MPPSQRDLTANFKFADKDTDPVFGYLIDPAGNAQAFGANVKVTGFDSNGAAVTSPLSTMSLFARGPAPGRWTLVLLFAPAVSGQNLAVPFSGSVLLNTVQASAGVPNNNNVKLPAGQATTVPLTVKNTGVAPQAFFVDARHNSTATVNLPEFRAATDFAADQGDRLPAAVQRADRGRRA